MFVPPCVDSTSVTSPLHVRHWEIDGRTMMTVCLWYRYGKIKGSERGFRRMEDGWNTPKLTHPSTLIPKETQRITSFPSLLPPRCFACRRCDALLRTLFGCLLSATSWSVPRLSSSRPSRRTLCLSWRSSRHLGILLPEKFGFEPSWFGFVLLHAWGLGLWMIACFFSKIPDRLGGWTRGGWTRGSPYRMIRSV
jgi:hypothetical protein